MSRYSDQVRDEYRRTVPGVKVYVYKWDADANEAGDLEILTDDSSGPLANPLTSDDDGIYYFNSVDGYKLLEFHYGGKVQERDLVLVGAVRVPQTVFGGLFLDAPALSIPVGMDLITTTGFSALDIGSAVYVHDAAVDPAYVTANPRVSFIEGGGRGFRLSLYQDISPQMFGAVGGGAADDTAAVIACLSWAFANGRPVCGGTVQFGVNGQIAMTGLTRPHIQSLKLKQLTPTGGVFTLAPTDCTEIRIDRLDIDVGSSAAIGNMDTTGGLQVLRGTGHNIQNVTVSGNGKVTYVRFWDCRESTFENISVHDGLFNDSSVDGTDARLLVADDVVQGIHIADCYRCTLVNPEVRSLHGNGTYYTQSGYIAGSPLTSTVKAFPNLRTRGICGGGNVDCTIFNPFVYDVEQAMDFSGGGNNWGNRNVQIIGGELINCGSCGVKFANAPNGCKAIGVTARNIGMYGFLLTGQTTAFQGQDSSFIDCEAINVGYNDIQFDTDGEGVGVAAYSGFYLLSSDVSVGGLIGGLVKNCRAIDKQGFYLATDDSPWALAGATSATMAQPWTGYTGTYPSAVFTTSAGTETRTVTLTNGSTTVSWTTGLTGNITHPFVSRPAAMQYGALCEAPYLAGSLKPNMCEGLLSVGHAKAAQKGFQRYLCRPSNSVATQTLTNNTNTAITWDANTDDTLGMHSTSSNTSRVTVPVAGVWRVSGFLVFTAGTGGCRRVELKVNGTTTKYDLPYATVSGDNTVCPFDAYLTLAANDYIEVYGQQTSGGSLTVLPNVSDFRVELLRAA